MVTTVTRIYRHHGAENSSRHFVPHLENAQAPPPLSQPIKPVCPAEPTVSMGIFVLPEYTHSTAIYKHRLAMAGARVLLASWGDIQCMRLPVCKGPHMASLSTGKGSGNKGGSATSWSRAGLRRTAQEQDKCGWAGSMQTVEWDSAWPGIQAGRTCPPKSVPSPPPGSDLKAHS